MKMNKRSMIALIALSSMVVAVQADNDGKKPHKKEKSSTGQDSKEKGGRKDRLREMPRARRKRASQTQGHGSEKTARHA